MGTLLQDVRYGVRSLARKPTFTIVAVLTLALGVGANTAIFSIVNAVLLRSLPYRDPDGLVRMFVNEPGVGLRDIRFSKPELDDLETRAGVFEDVSPILEGSENVTGAGRPERVEGVNGSFSYFSLLGVTPQIGRLFSAQDFTPGFAEEAVISDGLWRRTYGADPNVIGRTIRIDNDPLTIIGVLPPGFRHPGPTVSGDAEVFGAAGFSGDPFPKPLRGTRILGSAIGRLKPGLTLAQAQVRLTALAAQLRHDFPGDYPPEAQWTIEIQPLQETLVGNVRPMLLVLLGTVILIVFIVSLNIANLLLARASERQQEMAVRLALGASRGRMVRQMLTESMLLSLIGGAAGIATAVSNFGFHPALCAIEPSPAQRSTNRLGGAGLRSVDFRSHRLGVWPCSRASFGESRFFLGHSGRRSWVRLRQEDRPFAGCSRRLGTGICRHPDGRSRLAAAYAAGSLAGRSRIQSNSGCRGKHAASESQRSDDGSVSRYSSQSHF